ncbi:BCCT family transporter [Janibacter alkaliphilus]|uniref:Glycine betaine transporter n=1 Tax=Janibacter alkaliphilus TaxID=1069963 RepID=A0A852X6W1_9MICO|nr:BCCT family transporter [Janibacter alkaliphilus]NYG36503.1 glycine betaine transporter [Janibacter alkaliphilus]
MTSAPPEPSAARPRLGAVFWVSVTFSLTFVLVGVLSPETVADTVGGIREGVVERLGPVYPLTVLVVLLVVLGLAISPLGRIRLGEPDSRPEFGALSWLAMLLSAGVGLSFLFWGTAEPLIHTVEPPAGQAAPGSEAAARDGMRWSFLFWGVHAWALYAAVGYASYRRGRTVLISDALRPLLGRHADGPLGTVVDILSVIAILFGVATSLGLGTRELNAALEHTHAVPDSYGTKVAIIVGLMTVSTISAMTGLGRGIRLLSLANLALCAVLLVLVLVLGPTREILGTAGTGVADYVRHLVPMSLGTEGGEAGQAWQREWTHFFWAWWIAWAPFVGTFLARISHGRTIRGLVLGAVGVPGLVTVAWFSVLGGTALQRERTGATDVAEVAAEYKSVATLEVLGTLPLSGLALGLLVPVLALLFITSADSASFMLGSATSGGSMRPPRPLRLMWSFAAAFAAVLLLAGGPGSLRDAAVVAAVPFTVILLALCVALVRDVWGDRAGVRHESAWSPGER